MTPHSTESLLIGKAEGYSNSAKEKVTRGSIKSAVDRALTSSNTVIVDSMNYIKGFRYELYCSARTMRTPTCVVLVEANDSVSNAWNSQREKAEDRYDEKIFHDLRLRFERPQEKNRWDSPLFHVNMTPEAERSKSPENDFSAAASSIKLTPQSTSNSIDAQPTQQSTVFKRTIFKSKKAPAIIATSAADNANFGSLMSLSTSVIEDVNDTDRRSRNGSGATGDGTSLSISGSTTSRSRIGGGLRPTEIIQQILSFLETAIAPPTNASTNPKVHASADLLYQLDQVSQKIVTMIMNHQRDAVCEGTPIVLNEFERTCVFNRHISVAELQRHRRQFVKVHTNHPPSAGVDVGAVFVDFLAQQLS